MEESIDRIATSLSDEGFEVTIYTLKQPDGYRGDGPDARVSVEHLREDRELLVAPFGNGDRAAVGENSRATYLSLPIMVEQVVSMSGY